MLKEVNGKGVSFAQPVILDKNVEEDQEILNLMNTWLTNLTDAGYKEPIANTTVFLSKNGPGETNLGKYLDY